MHVLQPRKVWWGFPPSQEIPAHTIRLLCKWSSIMAESSLSFYLTSPLGSLCGMRSAQEHLLRQRSRQQDRHQELRWSARSDPAAQEDSWPGAHGHHHRLEACWGPRVDMRGVRDRAWMSWSMLTLFYAPPQVRCGTCPLMTPSKWRSWTTRCTPSLTRWWCRTRVGSKGAMVLEPGRRTANQGIWSGRRPSPTQPAAWGTQGWWAGDGRKVVACRYSREMEARQVNRLTEQQDVCGRKRTMGLGNCKHGSSSGRQTPAGRR